MREKAYKCHVICRRVRCYPRLVQDGESQIITVIKGVSAAGVAVEPMIIHQRPSHIAGWYTDTDEDELTVCGIPSSSICARNLSRRKSKELRR